VPCGVLGVYADGSSTNPTHGFGWGRKDQGLGTVGPSAPCPPSSLPCLLLSIHLHSRHARHSRAQHAVSTAGAAGAETNAGSKAGHGAASALTMRPLNAPAWPPPARARPACTLNSTARAALESLLACLPGPPAPAAPAACACLLVTGRAGRTAGCAAAPPPLWDSEGQADGEVGGGGVVASWAHKYRAGRQVLVVLQLLGRSRREVAGVQKVAQLERLGHPD